MARIVGRARDLLASEIQPPDFLRDVRGIPGQLRLVAERIETQHPSAFPPILRHQVEMVVDREGRFDVVRFVRVAHGVAPAQLETAASLMSRFGGAGFTGIWASSGTNGFSASLGFTGFAASSGINGFSANSGIA